MKIPVTNDNRFESDSSRYATYLETPEGRLRADLTFANLEDFLPTLPGARPLHALDLGCGTGATSVRLARLDCNVTLLDSSSAMLELAERTVTEAGTTDKVVIKHGDASMLAEILPARSFDVILCHNLLEYVDDPAMVLHSTVKAMRDSSSILSILVRNQAGEVLKAALQAGDLAAAKNALASEWVTESLYGRKVRLFALDKMRDLIKTASLRIIAERGVRIIADYLPPKVSRDQAYEQIFELERKLGSRTEFVAFARYMQFLARPLKDGA